MMNWSMQWGHEFPEAKRLNSIKSFTSAIYSVVKIKNIYYGMTGCYEPTRLFGVTTLDVVRAKAFIGEIVGEDPKNVSVPVIGGHAGVTILPVLSQSTPPLSISDEEAKKLMTRIQNAGESVAKMFLPCGENDIYLCLTSKYMVVMRFWKICGYRFCCMIYRLIVP